VRVRKTSKTRERRKERFEWNLIGCHFFYRITHEKKKEKKNQRTS
jgi:hypothetical protein